MDDLIKDIEYMIMYMEQLQKPPNNCMDVKLGAFDAELGLRKIQVALLKIKIERTE